MEARQLIDPAWWSDPAPIAMGAGGEGPGRWAAEVPELAGHLMFRTSGSTGVAKWIALSKDALLLSAAAVNRHLKVDADSCWGLALPLHHVGGFGVMARAYEAACRYEVFPSRWDAAEFAAWLAKYEVSHSSLVPTQVHDIVRSGIKAPGCLKAIVVGGGKFREDLREEALTLGWPMLPSFGMTEACSQVATAEADDPQGRMRVLTTWEVRVGANDLLELRGGSLFTGWVRPLGDGWSFEKREGEWFTTQDRGVIHKDRVLEIFGRSDAWVKVLGELIDPVAIEERLQKIADASGDVCELAVVALPDARSEHRLVLAAVGASQAVANVLEVFHRECAGYERITEVREISYIPRTELGKIARAELRKLIGD